MDQGVAGLKGVDDAILVSQLIGKLPDRQLVIIDMVFFQGYSQREIAGELHVSPSRISQLKTDALRRLKKAV